MYKIQSAKYGYSWEDYYSEDSFTSLQSAIEYALEQETHDKYCYRVVDESGKVVYTRTIPYEGVAINLADDTWLQNIFADYGVSKELAFAAILKWLSIHTTPNGF